MSLILTLNCDIHEFVVIVWMAGETRNGSRNVNRLFVALRADIFYVSLRYRYVFVDVLRCRIEFLYYVL